MFTWGWPQCHRSGCPATVCRSIAYASGWCSGDSTDTLWHGGLSDCHWRTANQRPSRSSMWSKNGSWRSSNKFGVCKNNWSKGIKFKLVSSSLPCGQFLGETLLKRLCGRLVSWCSAFLLFQRDPVPKELIHNFTFSKSFLFFLFPHLVTKNTNFNWMGMACCLDVIVWWSS